ncbi:amino acid transporter AVT6E [Eurytemora carolleeae]|uniref:amino acid transporter AVT6E n=1 Tax=Eurytemora carolleeae TaxID=1294199 RepID=UPI000C76E053|nr:amino acid transporter AVT6E [Eurytemora carolleeae]|eukprot:XP_023335307.1 amino acid transporter AVT6E-like [Eurytemora affinis]
MTAVCVYYDLQKSVLRMGSAIDEEDGMVKSHGLSMLVAGLFLAGEMAGSGVLALPSAMIGTGPAGLALIVIFAIFAVFVGTRLGYCWIILEERYPEFREQVRDPYPAIAEKAVGKTARIVSLVCISITQYGTGCVYIVIMSTFIHNLAVAAGFEMNPCIWMVVLAVGMCPVCWLGTPNDFWQIAVSALITTTTACIIIMVKESLDVRDSTSCYYTELGSWEPVFPAPSAEGFFKGNSRYSRSKALLQ